MSESVSGVDAGSAPPAPAADERLREAGEKLAAAIFRFGSRMDCPEYLHDAAREFTAALAGVPAEATTEPGPACDGIGCGCCAAEATPDKCRAPHCWSEYGTPCGDCPTLAGARKDTDSASVVAPPPNPYRDLSVTTREGAKHYAWKMGYAAGVVVGKSLPSTGTGWDRGYAAGVAAERDQAWRWTIHVCPKGHKSLEPPLNGVCWKCWPGGRGPAEEHTAIRVAEVRR